MPKAHRRPHILVTALAIFSAIAAVSTVFIAQMSDMIYTSTASTITELADHDMASIQRFIRSEWDALHGVAARLTLSQCDTPDSAHDQLSLERNSCSFYALYLVREDGTVYSDRYGIYHTSELKLDTIPEEVEAKPELARRYDFRLSYESRREMLLCAIRLHDYYIDGMEMVALVGISDINQIKKNLVINSFEKDGTYRGYSSVINSSGNFIVSVEEDDSLAHQQSMFDLLDKCTLSGGWTTDLIAKRMAARESFHFNYKDEDGVKKLLYFIPIEDTVWYFVSSVEREVFAAPTRSFIFSSVFMVLVSVLGSVFLLFLVFRSRNSMLRANAESKARSEFLSNMSHEIRTPLNGLIGLLYLMRTHLDTMSTHQLEEYLDKSESTANYLMSLVSDILDMSKLQAGKLDMVSRPFDLNKAFEAVVAMQRDNIENREISFSVENGITTPWVIGDEVHLKQVLMNIVGNAAKFTPAGGHITLTAHQEPAADGKVRTVLTCADTGIGMSPDFLKTIWDSFSQERSRQTASIRGTGLGMALSKRFVNGMGGEISVESRLKEGSTFTVVLDLPVTEPMDSLPGELPPAEEGAPSGHMKLLVAEDNELNAEILTEILTDSGFEVVLAGNGQIAVDKFLTSQPGEFSAILMDMQMPVLDGCDATRVIRALEREDAKTITIFACTANTFQEDKDRALGSGMNDFLTKPIDVDEMLDKLKAR